MRRTSGTFSINAIALSVVLSVGACKQEPKKPPESEAKQVEKTPPPQPAQDSRPVNIDLSGPQPPEVHAVFFSVNGALLPLACYNADKKQLQGGPECGNMIPSDTEVYLASETGSILDKVGDKKNALCELDNKPTSFATSQIDAGASFDWAAWPRPLAALVEQVPTKTTTPRAAQLDEDESKAIMEAIHRQKKSIKGELRGKQKASIDIDGDEKKEVFISAVVADPKDPDRQHFSGLWMAPGGDLKQLIAIETSKRSTPETYTLRGIIDLDGNGHSELWISLSFDGGAGERVFVIEKNSNKIRSLSNWSCGT